MEEEKLPWSSMRCRIGDVKPTKENPGLARKERTLEVTLGNQETRTVEVRDGKTIDVKDQEMKDIFEYMLKQTNDLGKKYHWTFIDTMGGTS